MRAWTHDNLVVFATEQSRYLQRSDGIQLKSQQAAATCMYLGGRAITPSRLCVQSYIINNYSLARLSKRTRSEFPARAM